MEKLGSYCDIWQNSLKKPQSYWAICLIVQELVHPSDVTVWYRKCLLQWSIAPLQTSQLASFTASQKKKIGTAAVTLYSVASPGYIPGSNTQIVPAR